MRINKTFLESFLYALLVFFLSNVAYSEGVNIKYGLWETKSTVTMPIGGGTQEHVSQDCIEEDITTPEQLMKNAQNCEITDKEIADNSMHWTVKCLNADIEMIGQGELHSTETTYTGSMEITASINGQDVVMNTNWEGKYIGKCS